MQLDGLNHLRSGKVRDIYALGDDLLIVATDRISAFDWVLPNRITDKGRLLTSLSLFWFDFLAKVTENHLITADVAKMPAVVQKHTEYLSGRSMLVRKATVIPIECVIRGYLTGSGFKEYKATGKVCGISLPHGIKDSEKLPEPIFTPATKEDSGHDINVSFQEASKIVGLDVMTRLRDLSLAIYLKASEHAIARGIIIADTKFEFGTLPDGSIILIDEVLTPDSSRFWPADKYVPGKSQPSFDKQIVRDWLETTGWDKASPPPVLPDDVVNKTIAKYREVRDLLTT
jgi:phosphoribosylaminoimidazole-succinocarboxamide synthase